MACPLCASPLDVVQPRYLERRERSVWGEIGIYRCPQCGQRVLDDQVGWRGSGIVFHVDEQGVAQYLATGLPPAPAGGPK